MQIPTLSGVYMDTAANVRTSYPRNLIPVPKESGISNSVLQPAEGLVQFGTGPGIDRGGKNWNGICYRVMGSSFVSVDSLGNVTIIGDVGNDGNPVSMDVGFTQIAIASNRKLYYYNGLTLVQMTDPNLLAVIDVIWIDSYFMVTDGNTVAVTTLDNPLAINPLAYGSAEVDPDPIVALLKIRDEATLVGRYTIEVLQDVGGNLFPFQRIAGAEVLKGSIGRKTCCQFFDQVAFLGSGRNEPPAVYLAVNGVYTKVSTLEIEKIIKLFGESQLSGCVLEPRIEENHAYLYLHLPDRTLVYDYNASQAYQRPVWFTLDSGLGPVFSQYRAQFLVWVYDKWIFGDPTTAQLGVFSQTNGDAYDNNVSWEFSTVAIYNKANGAIVHELELIAATGEVQWGANPTISTSYSTDGQTWSVDRWRPAGIQGNRNIRLNWLFNGNMRTWRIQRFRGTSAAHMSIIALEARLEPLKV